MRFGSIIALLVSYAWGQSSPSLEDFPLSLQRSIELEQKLIGVRDKSGDTLDPQYQPEAGKIFRLPTFWVNADEMQIRVDESMPAELRRVMFRKHGGRAQVLVSVHPDESDYFPELLARAEPGRAITATPSASPRSLIAVAEEAGKKVAFYNKLSVNKRLGGNVRLIHKSELARSFYVTQLLSLSRERLPENFVSYPEYMVMIPKNAEMGGSILRGVTPELSSGKVEHIPFFALYAPRPDGSPPLIVEMAQKAGKAVDAYFFETMVKPFLRQWMDLALDHGIVMEPHGQNLLLEVDARNKMPTDRFVHRDFGGFTIDTELRRRLGLPLPQNRDINGYQAHYDMHDIGYAYKTSLDLYFANIVANFGSQFEGWYDKGWVKVKLGEKDFHRRLVQETEKVYEEKTGLKIDLQNHLAKLLEPMLAARDRIPFKPCSVFSIRP